MKTTWIDYSIFVLTILLLFVLVFNSAIEVPPFLLSAGRLHPVLLHFPIVLIMLAVYKTWRYGHPGTIFLGITALLTLLTAISGMVLQQENNAGGATINNHMWSGSALALGVAIWFWTDGRRWPLKHLRMAFVSVIFALVLATGHLGGMVTHGSDFLTLPWSNDEVLPASDPDLYADILQPLLNDKCVTCHNPGKKKGGLQLTDYASLLAGGENGPAIAQGKPSESLLIQRMELPLEHEKHMPPASKMQPTANELAVVNAWIAEGAPQAVRLSQLSQDNALYLGVMEMLARRNQKADSWEDLPEVTEDEIDKLTNDYRTVKRMYAMSNALSISIFPHRNYQANLITDLQPVQSNIVELDVSGLPLRPEDFEWIGQCKSLKRLDLDNTPIEDDQVSSLANIKYLEHLKLHNTGISDRSVSTLGSLNQLKNLYLWNTDITRQGIAELRKLSPEINIDLGIDIGDFVAKADSLEAEVGKRAGASGPGDSGQ